MEQSVYLAIPHTGSVSGQSLPGLIWATNRGQLMVSPGQVSLLATNFNRLWTDALNKRAEAGLTHWAMHHSDIEAPQFWVDSMIDELERVGADILSAVVCLKDDRGLTTTAVATGSSSIRRLTLREVHELPETFSLRDIPGDDPTRRLMVNTGLWVCRFTEKWIEPPNFPGFQLKDQIRWNPERNLYEAVCLSEDWGFSEWAHHQGLKVFATRKIPVTHYGTTGYSNQRVTGRWTTDLGDARAEETPEKREEPMPSEQEMLTKIGRMQMEIEAKDAEKDAILNELAFVVSGEVAPNRVLVNLTAKTFTRVAQGETVGMPATFNGLPKCVVGEDRVAALQQQLTEAQAENMSLKARLKAFEDEIAKLPAWPLVNVDYVDTYKPPTLDDNGDITRTKHTVTCQ